MKRQSTADTGAPDLQSTEGRGGSFSRLSGPGISPEVFEEIEEIVAHEQVYESWKNTTWNKPPSQDRPSKMNLAVAQIMRGEENICEVEPSQAVLEANTMMYSQTQEKGLQAEELVALALRFGEVIRMEAKVAYINKVATLLEVQFTRTLENKETLNK